MSSCFSITCMHGSTRSKEPGGVAIAQYASVTIWFLEEYYGYGVIILIITAGALLITCWTAYHSQARLARIAAFSCPVVVPGTGSSPATTTIQSSEIVPGESLHLLLGPFQIWLCCPCPQLCTSPAQQT